VLGTMPAWIRDLTSDVARLRRYAGALAAVVLIGFSCRTHDPSMLGLPLIIVGLAIRLWAAGHVSKHRVLTTSGPYRYVRHPLYLGTIIAFLGWPLVLERYWLALIVFAIIVPVYLWQIAAEERQLCQAFGQQYESYRRAVPALLPVPWRVGPPKAARFDWRRAIVINGWYKGVLWTVLGLAAIDLMEDLLYPAVFMGRPLSACVSDILDFTAVWRTGHF